MTTWQETNIETGQRMIDYARSCMPGQIGAVPLHMTTEIDEIPLEMLGERPVIQYDDRHRRYEEDFNALVAIELAAGRVDEATAMRAQANFHDYSRATNLSPVHTSPRFFQ